jgi:hypothetical protein
MRKLFHAIAAAGALLLSQASAADDEPGWLDQAWNELDETWRQGTTEYYATFRTWHTPWAYSDEQNSQYQNWPPGLGIGRGRFDEKGNWHGVYALGFQDSHFKPEWVVGYSWKKYWQGPGSIRLSLGYTAGVSTRADIGHYTPFPIILPIASADFGKISVEGAYVPGGKGFGNVMLLWLKWHSDSKSIFGWTP